MSGENCTVYMLDFSPWFGSLFIFFVSRMMFYGLHEYIYPHWMRWFCSSPFFFRRQGYRDFDFSLSFFFTTVSDSTPDSIRFDKSEPTPDCPWLAKKQREDQQSTTTPGYVRRNLFLLSPRQIGTGSLMDA